MLNSIAIIGYGFVGKACHKAFEHNTEAIIIDPKVENDYNIEQLRIFKPRLTFVALPAPTLEDGSVDASIIYTVFQQLADIGYAGLVVLKSTLPPDVVDDLYIKFGRSKVENKSGLLRYIYSPEFIREACWETDAINPSQIIMAGDFFDCKELEEIYRNHSHVKNARFHLCHHKEAALVKYAINTFLATKVVFMNQLYALYSDMYGKSPIHPESWEAFTDMLTTDIRFGRSHTTVPGNNGEFGYGGTCFPKDVKAMIGFDRNERLSVLREVELANTKIRLQGDTK